MTRCPRCTGFVHSRIIEHPDVIETHCLSCGWYHNPPLPVPPRDAYSRKDRCANCQESCEAGYKQCPKCRAYQKRYRETGERRKRTGPILPVVLIVEKQA